MAELVRAKILVVEYNEPSEPNQQGSILENLVNNKSYNDIVELAIAHGFEGNPRGTKKVDLIEFITTHPLNTSNEVKDPVQENEEENKEEIAQSPTTPAAETPKDPAPKKKNQVTEARRGSIAQLVESKMEELTKPTEHTELFYTIFGKDFPKGPDANTKWRDVGNSLLALVNSGKVISSTPEGKKRSVFAWKRDEVATEPPAPESTNTEGEGI